MMNEFSELKKIVFDLKAKVETLEFTIPHWFSLGDIAKDLKISRDTIRKYLKSNFEPDVDYKLDGGKIYISRNTLFLIKARYEK